MLSFLQKLGKSFMLPIAVLPAVGIILALGREDVFNIPFVYQAGTAVLIICRLFLRSVLPSAFQKTAMGQRVYQGRYRI